MSRLGVTCGSAPLLDLPTLGVQGTKGSVDLSQVREKGGDRADLLPRSTCGQTQGRTRWGVSTYALSAC